MCLYSLMKRYVAYYRVSTKHQGKSGLGLDAQKTSVEKYIDGKTLLGEFTDIESGTRKGNKKRDELMKAIALAKSENAVLVIAKLDRLSRNVSFITAIMESGVEFVACDIPHASKFTIHIFAALAEQEADMISMRVRESLSELKKKGTKLGKPENLNASARSKGCMTRQANAITNENNVKAGALVVSMKSAKFGNIYIAEELNRLGFSTRRGCKFNPSQVERLYHRYLAVSG